MRLSFILAATALGFAGWIFLQFGPNKQNKVSLDYREDISLISQLTATNTRLNEQVLFIRTGARFNYDTLVKYSAVLRGLSSDLHRRKGIMSGVLQREKAQDNGVNDNLLDAIESKLLAVENFKTTYAVMRNSQQYLPLAVSELSPFLSQAEKIEIYTIMSKIYLYLAAPDNNELPNLAPLLSTFLEGIESSKPRYAKIENVSVHARLLLMMVTSLESIIDTILDVHIDHSLTRLVGVMGVRYHQERERHEQQRAIAYTIIVLLLFYVAFVFIKWRQTACLLAHTLFELEHQQFAQDQHSIIVMTDPAGKIIYANDKFCDVSQFSNSELIGNSHRLVHSGHHDKDFFREMWQTITAGETWHGEVCNKKKNGDLYWVETTIVPFVGKGGEIEKYISIRTDITEQKQAVKFANAASKTKSMFVSTMSHEIRTPLNGIVGMTDLLLDTLQTTEQRQLGDMLRASAKALITIVGDVLEFSKIEAGHLSVVCKPFNIRDLVQQVTLAVDWKQNNSAVDLQIHIDPQIPTLLLGDSGRLRQVLLNLLHNAMKFTEAGTVTLSLTGERVPSVQQTGDRVCFSVQDTGIGLSEKAKQSIFDPFIQVQNSSSRQYGGTGLGLSICSKIVTMMGGEIEVTSVLGEGAEFFFTVTFPDLDEQEESLSLSSPSILPALQETPLSLENSQIFSGVRIMLVEDNIINQKVAERHFKKLGCVIDILSDGLQAVQALAQGENRYDIIFMDCQMPVMDGYEATEKIRQWESESKTGVRHPIVAITANAMHSDRDRCLKAGMDDYITKPISRAALAAILQHYIIRH